MSKVVYGQSGYVGQSMSVRACEAYEAGEKPKSKWNKTTILETFEAWCADHDQSPIIVPKWLTAEELKEFLYVSSWHHTGKYGMRTNFYSLDCERLAEATWQDVNEQAEYVVARLTTGETVVGGVHGKTFISDSGERYTSSRFEVVESKPTRAYLEEQEALKRAQIWEEWVRECLARGVHPVKPDGREYVTGELYVPADVFEQAVEQYEADHGYLPDSVAAFAAEHPECCEPCPEAGQHVMYIGDVQYDTRFLTAHRVKNWDRYSDVRSVMETSMFGSKWMSKEFLQMPEIRVHPVYSSTDDDCSLVLSRLWEEIYHDPNGACLSIVR